MRRRTILLVVCVALIAALWALSWWPWFVERVYARGISFQVSRALSILTSVVPISLAALLIPGVIVARKGELNPTFILFYLAIASTVGGAIVGQAPERSRALWLRGGWSREALFTAVEKSAWRHNGLVLVALLTVFLGVGSFVRFPLSVMALGIPMVLVGSVLSTYLGLMLTRGVRWPEATLGVAVMLTMMGIALTIAETHVNPWLPISALAVLAALSNTLRQFARRRWLRIDWSECRPDAQRALRAG